MEAPFHQTTAIARNGDGLVQTVAVPGDGDLAFTYWSGGLLRTKTNPREQGNRYDYDTFGRLTTATDEAGHFKTLTRTEVGTGAYQVELKTPLNRKSTYRVERLADGSRKLTNTFTWRTAWGVAWASTRGARLCSACCTAASCRWPPRSPRMGP